jgi:hypothetical protein
MALMGLPAVLGMKYVIAGVSGQTTLFLTSADAWGPEGSALIVQFNSEQAARTFVRRNQQTSTALSRLTPMGMTYMPPRARR